jgi:hypothetical protein
MLISPFRKGGSKGDLVSWPSNQVSFIGAPAAKRRGMNADKWRFDPWVTGSRRRS